MLMLERTVVLDTWTSKIVIVAEFFRLFPSFDVLQDFVILLDSASIPRSPGFQGGCCGCLGRAVVLANFVANGVVTCGGGLAAFVAVA
jgi:hypothetical protein